MFDSMHADEVRFPRELKTCEQCGTVFVRLVPIHQFQNLTITITPERYCKAHRQECDILIGFAGAYNPKWLH